MEAAHLISESTNQKSPKFKKVCQKGKKHELTIFFENTSPLIIEKNNLNVPIIPTICLLFVGMDIVYKIESFGSRNGKTSKKILIDDCGEVD